MTYEHEAMHAETLLYMLLQSPNTVPPPGFAPPNFAHLATLWSAQQERDALEPSTITFGPLTLDLGHHDLEAEDKQATADWERGVGHEFGWDNEHGRTRVEVGKVTFERKGVTNGEYREFLKKTGGKIVPGSWIEVDGEIKVSSSLLSLFPTRLRSELTTSCAGFLRSRLSTDPSISLSLSTGL